MSKEVKFIINGIGICLVVMIAFLIWLTKEESKPKPSKTYEWIPETPTVILAKQETPTCTATPTVTPTKAQEHTETPTPTNTPLPTNTPTESPVRESAGVVGEKYCEVNGTHGWKPLAWYTAVNDRTMPQWRLQQIAKTDERGVRVVQDPNGEWRYCVALPVYWAGGTHEDIGRCIDIYMVNGSILKCVLGDTKRIRKSVNGEGKYGIGHNEVIEVQCDLGKIPPYALQRGDASFIGDEWDGEAKKIVVLDMFITGFGKE